MNGIKLFKGILVLLLMGCGPLLAQKGLGTNDPDPQAALDIQSPDKGVLLPRIGLVSSTHFLGGVAATASHTGMLVYNTNTATNTGLVGVGLYQWNRNQWEKFTTEGDLFWDLDRDTGIQVEEGTDDDTIRFDTAGSQRMLIAPDGRVGIGNVTSPESNLHIEGGGLISSAAPTLKLRSTSGSGLVHQRLFFETHANSRGGGISWTETGNSSRTSFLGQPYQRGYLTYAFTDTASSVLRHNDQSVIFKIHNRTGRTSIGGGHDPTATLDVGGDARIRSLPTGANTDAVLTVNQNGFLRTLPLVGQLIDADGDTQIQVEENPDDDTIRFDALGEERVQINADQFISNIDLVVQNTATSLSQTPSNTSYTTLLDLSLVDHSSLTLSDLSIYVNSTLFATHTNGVSSTNSSGITISDSTIVTGNLATSYWIYGHSGSSRRFGRIEFRLDGTKLQARRINMKFEGSSSPLTPIQQTNTYFLSNGSDSGSNVTIAVGLNNYTYHTPAFFIVDQSTARVGIGTDTPARALHVNGATRITSLPTGAASDVIVTANADGDLGSLPLAQVGTDSQTLAFDNASATATQTTITLDNSQSLTLTASGSLSFNTTSSSTLELIGDTGQLIDADGDTQIQVEESSDDDTIRFDTANTQRMLIDADGQIGIGGVVDPWAELHFSNDVDNRKLILWQNGTLDNDHQFYGFGIGGLALRHQVPEAADHVFYSGTSSATSQELVRIKGTGNVGIGGLGSAGVTQTLTVSGTAQITGALHDSSGDAGTNGQVLTSTLTGTDWISTTQGHLERITEGSNTGYRIFMSNPNNFGDIGSSAVDLSIQLQSSTTRGATGAYSTAVGVNNTSSGGAAFTAGEQNIAGGTSSVAMGVRNTASRRYAAAFGSDTHASGEYSFTNGRYTTAESYGQTTLGFFNTSHPGTPDPDSSVDQDRLFVIGNGDSFTQSDALVMLKNGNTTLNGSLHVTDQYRDSNGDAGTAGQVLSSTATGTDWVDMGITGVNIKKVYSAEYAGAVLSADGTDNLGTMTAGNSATNSFMNYYQWSSSQSSPQDYDVVLRFTLPSDFKSWQSDAIQVDYVVSDAASATLYTFMYPETGGSALATASGTATTWTQVPIASATDLTSLTTPGETAVIILKLEASNDATVRIGDVTLNYVK